MINELFPHQIFVFGSNELGQHIAGAAKQALQFGAVMGQGRGHQGQTYAIATLDDNFQKMSLASIQAQLYILSQEAKEHPQSDYLLTPIGTGIAGFSIEEIKDILPKSFPKNVILVGDWK